MFIILPLLVLLIPVFFGVIFYAKKAHLLARVFNTRKARKTRLPLPLTLDRYSNSDIPPPSKARPEPFRELALRAVGVWKTQIPRTLSYFSPTRSLSKGSIETCQGPVSLSGEIDFAEPLLNPSPTKEVFRAASLVTRKEAEEELIDLSAHDDLIDLSSARDLEEGRLSGRMSPQELESQLPKEPASSPILVTDPQDERNLDHLNMTVDPLGAMPRMDDTKIHSTSGEHLLDPLQVNLTKESQTSFPNSLSALDAARERRPAPIGILPTNSPYVTLRPEVSPNVTFPPTPGFERRRDWENGYRNDNVRERVGGVRFEGVREFEEVEEAMLGREIVLVDVKDEEDEEEDDSNSDSMWDRTVDDMTSFPVVSQPDAALSLIRNDGSHSWSDVFEGSATLSVNTTQLLPAETLRHVDEARPTSASYSGRSLSPLPTPPESPESTPVELMMEYRSHRDLYSGSDAEADLYPSKNKPSMYIATYPSEKDDEDELQSANVAEQTEEVSHNSLLPSRFESPCHTEEDEVYSHSPVPTIQIQVHDASPLSSPTLETVPQRPAWSLRADDAPPLGLSSRTSSPRATPQVASSELPDSNSPSSPRVATAVELGEVTGEKTIDGKAPALSVKDEHLLGDEESQQDTLKFKLKLLEDSQSLRSGKEEVQEEADHDDPPLPTFDSLSRPVMALPFNISRPRSMLDVALAMQLRPGLGLGADAAWMVRFLMAMFGWFAVLVAGRVDTKRILAPEPPALAIGNEIMVLHDEDSEVHE